MKLISFYLLACAAFWATSVAAEPISGVHMFKAGEPIQIDREKAYILLRIDTSSRWYSSPDLLRIPTRGEIDSYEAAKHVAYEKAGKNAGPYETFVFDYKGRPNFYELNAHERVAMSDKTAILLAEIPPGDYVLYGQGYSRFLYECYCYGTVGFTVRAGTISDLGTMFFARADEPSSVPELASETALGPTAKMDYYLFAAALRPKRAGDPEFNGIPQPAIPAKFHAVGSFVETNTMLANRLAAIPGVLAYDGGRVIDVASGEEAKPN